MEFGTTALTEDSLILRFERLGCSDVVQVEVLDTAEQDVEPSGSLFWSQSLANVMPKK